MKKPLVKQTEELQILSSSAIMLFGHLRNIPYPTRRQLRARLSKIEKKARSLRKQVAGY